MSMKLINKVEKARKRSDSVLNHFTETQQRLQSEIENLEAVKSESEEQIEMHRMAMSELQDIYEDATAEQERNTKSIDGINFVLNGNN